MHGANWYQCVAGLGDEPTDSGKSTCKRCGLLVDLPPSDDFVTLCGPRCYGPPQWGPMKSLPETWRNR